MQIPMSGSMKRFSSRGTPAGNTAGRLSNVGGIREGEVAGNADDVIAMSDEGVRQKVE